MCEANDCSGECGPDFFALKLKRTHDTGFFETMPCQEEAP